MIMKHVSRLATSGAVLLLCGAAVLSLSAVGASAQQDNPTYSDVIPPAVAVTLHAKIDAIDRQTRAVTLTGVGGRTVTLVAGPAVRLELLKVGDKVNATFYRSVAFVVSPPGTAVPEDEMKAALARHANVPGGAAVAMTRISGLVVGIDLAAHSVDLVNPKGGGVITVEVTDPARQAAMAGIKVGDTLTAVVSQALAVSIEPAPKGWF